MDLLAHSCDVDDVDPTAPSARGVDDAVTRDIDSRIKAGHGPIEPTQQLVRDLLQEREEHVAMTRRIALDRSAAPARQRPAAEPRELLQELRLCDEVRDVFANRLFAAEVFDQEWVSEGRFIESEATGAATDVDRIPDAIELVNVADDTLIHAARACHDHLPNRPIPTMYALASVHPGHLF